MLESIFGLAWQTGIKYEPPFQSNLKRDIM